MEGEAFATAEQLSMIWFVLLGVLLSGYLILDGFDLGVGILHLLLAKSEDERRLSINSIGPLWDGNEVWLVTFGGALFAMFPYAYATVVPAFYTAITLLLFALIFRAVSMEFRGKMGTVWGRAMWDIGFSGGSFLATLLFGVAAGNVIAGLELNNRGEFTGTLLSQLQPYALTTGIFLVSLFMLHGSIFLYMKLEGEYQHRVGRAMVVCWVLFALLYCLLSAWTIFGVREATANFDRYRMLWLVPVTNATCVLLTGWFVLKRMAILAFAMNAATIVSLTFLLAAALFPNIVNATDPANDLRIVDAASSPRTLTIGLIVVAIGLPFVLIYTTVIYWTFRGKTQLEPHSY